MTESRAKNDPVFRAQMGTQPDDHSGEISERLRAARSKIFKTAAEAARSLDMKPVTVRAHETGQNRPGVHDLERYARRYGVSLEWLLLGRGAKEPTLELELAADGVVMVECYLQDGVWLEMSEESDYFPVQNALAATGFHELVPFTDPRYPDDWIDGFKVRSDKTEGEYVNGTIVFAVPFGDVGYGVGDHLVIIRVRGQHCEWTLRKVERDAAGEIIYSALTSDDAPFPFGDPESPTYTHIAGIVIGHLTRRPNTQVPTISHRKHIELSRFGFVSKKHRLPKTPTQFLPPDTPPE